MNKPVVVAIIVAIVAAGVGFYMLTSKRPAESESHQLTVPRVYSGFLMLPEENEWSGGLCYLGSFAMLLEYDNSALDFSDVVACSGIGTYAEYGGLPGGPMRLGVGRVEPCIINAASNLGYDLVLGIGTNGTAGDFVTAAAQTKTFNTQDEAFSYLKSMIDSNIPVEVHLDIYYVGDDFAESSEKWTDWIQSEKQHASHFMVVTGYDATNIYLNDPTEPDSAAAVNMPTTVGHFLQAWSEGANESIQGAQLGPYWMIYIQRSGGAKSTEEIKSWNKEISENSASQIRAYAATSPSGANTFWNELAKARKEFATFLQKTSSTEAATPYENAAELYRVAPDIAGGEMPEVVEEYGDIVVHLNNIADLEENARALY